LLGIFLSFHVACGSTYYETDLCYRPLFRDFPNEVRASQPVSNGLSLTQDIRVTCNGLTEVRVWVMPSTTDDPGKTRFILTETSGEHLLLDTSIDNDQIRAEMFYPLQFELDGHSAGRQYRLKIIGMTEQGLQFLYTPQHEFNLGDSYENGQLLEQDLVLQYGCATGLRKIWWTSRP
jgi:hypothetical protein